MWQFIWPQNITMNWSKTLSLREFEANLHVYISNPFIFVQYFLNLGIDFRLFLQNLQNIMFLNLLTNFFIKLVARISCYCWCIRHLIEFFIRSIVSGELAILNFDKLINILLSLIVFVGVMLGFALFIDEVHCF